MTILQRKLWRTIVSTKWPFLALVLVVAVGMATFYGLNNTQINIEESRKQYYRQTGFANHYFEVTGAPDAVCRIIRELPGVASVSGRLVIDVRVLRADQSSTIGRLVGYSFPMSQNVNRLFITEGNLFAAQQANRTEVVLDETFKKSNHLQTGDMLTLLVKNRLHTVRIAGKAESPEFSSIQKGAIFEYVGDSFGIIMLPLDAMQRLMGLSGMVNQILVDFVAGSNIAVVNSRIESVLRPYGLQRSYGRSEHPAEKGMQEKLDGLRTSTYILPSVFFVVGLSFLYIQLGQLVKAQRSQIGIMKALGYGNSSIMLFYLGYALAIACTGVFIGFIAGTWLSSMFLGIYNAALSIPIKIDRINPGIVVEGALLFCLSAAFSCLLATRKIIAIHPAEAIRPAPPHINGTMFLEHVPMLWQRLSSSWKMSLRVIQRNRIRFAVTAFGIAAAIALLIIGRSFLDSKNFVLFQYYHQQNAFTHTIRFDSPVKLNDIASWRGWHFVRHIEPALQLAGNLSRSDAPDTISEILTGINLSTLKGPLNEMGERFTPPQEGIIISQRVAERLHLRKGDTVVVSFPAESKLTSRTALKVMGVCPQYVGSESYMSLEQANRLLHDASVVNVVFMETVNDSSGLLREQLKKIPKVSSLIDTDLQEAQAQKSVSGLIYFALIITALAVIMGGALIFNTSVVNFNERIKEVATLRVIGYTQTKISLIFLHELGLALIFGALAGLPGGIYIAKVYIHTVNTEFFHYQPVTSGFTITASLLTATVVGLLGHLVAMNRLGRLDLVETLKEKS